MVIAVMMVAVMLVASGTLFARQAEDDVQLSKCPVHILNNYGGVNL